MTRAVRAVAVAAAGCLLAGCGVRPTGVVSAGEAPTATATSLPKSQVFFISDGVPKPVERSVPPWDTQAVFDALLEGPTAQERKHGLRTALTPDVTIHTIGTRALFIESRESSFDMALQIVCTARLLPAAPVARASDGVLMGFLFKISAADECSPGTGGSQFPGPAGTVPGGDPYTQPAVTSPTDDPTGPALRKRPPLPKRGAGAVPKPTG